MKVSRKTGKEPLQCQEPKHWIWRGELEACMTGEAAFYFRNPMEGSSLSCSSAGTDPVHSSGTGGDDFPSGECHCLYISPGLE